MKILETSDNHHFFSWDTEYILEKFWAKVAKENPELIIIAGDEVSSSTTQLKPYFKLVRGFVPNTPIAWVSGNHNWWLGPDIQHWSIKRIRQYCNAVCNRFNVWNLNDKTRDYIVATPNKIIGIYGFDGWYAISDPMTNDKSHMGRDAYYKMTQLPNLAYKEAQDTIDRCLKNNYDFNICVTHFAPFTDDESYRDMCANFSLLDELSEHFDMVFVGHSHQKCDFIHNGCQWINSGSDYDNPKYIIVEI